MDDLALIGYFAAYKGYTGTIEYDYEENIYYGCLTDIRDYINYEGKSVEEMYKSFKEAVDDYINFKVELKSKGKDSGIIGTFNSIIVCNGEKCSKKKTCKHYIANIHDEKVHQYIDYSIFGNCNYTDNKIVKYWCGDDSDNYPLYEEVERNE